MNVNTRDELIRKLESDLDRIVEFVKTGTKNAYQAMYDITDVIHQISMISVFAKEAISDKDLEAALKKTVSKLVVKRGVGKPIISTLKEIDLHTIGSVFSDINSA